MSNNFTDKEEITQKIMEELRDLGKKKGISINEMLADLLNKSKDSTKESTSKKKEAAKNKKTNQKIDVTADLSKLLPQNNPEFIEILQRMAESMENIEREHAQGWSDQRKDLQAISKRMDKVL